MTAECVGRDHGHRDWLAQENTTVTVTFDMGISADAEVVVMTYIDGVWTAAESVVNNGDGTLTCVFEDICPVVFCVEEDYNITPPKTGDEIGRKLPLWIALMVISLIAIVVLVILYRKKDKGGHHSHKHHHHHKH